MPPVVIAVAIAIATEAWTMLAVVVAQFVVNSLLQSTAGKRQAPAFQPFTIQARDRTQIVRSSVTPRRVVYGTALVSGPLVFAASTGSSKDYMHLVVPVAGHEAQEIGDVFFNDVNSTDERFDGYFRVNKHLGASDQAADSDLVSEVEEWTEQHQLRGVAYFYVRLKWNRDVWPTGLPNVNAIVKGRKVFDPRTGVTAFSNNPALCIRDFLVSSFGLSADADEIDEASFIAAANVCDEDVPLSDTESQKRYTLDGTFGLDAKPIDVIEDLLTSCAGVLVYTQGRYRLTAGAAATATAALTADDLRGAVTVRPRISRRELYNSVRGTFVDPEQSWQATDFPPVLNSTYETQDGGERISRDIELPYTTDNVRAQRIGKIFLEMSRQGITVDFPAKLTALKIAVWDVVTVTLPHLGWSNKLFRVTSWTLSEEGGVDLLLQEYSSASYDWNSGDATIYDPAPDTNLPKPWVVAQPIALAVSEDLYVTRDGNGVKTKAILTWEPAPDTFVTSYLVEYKLTSASEYQVAGQTPGTMLEILDVEPGIYDFRVKAINLLQVGSLYSNLQQEIFGLAAPPSTITGLSISAIASIAILSWNQVQDLDVKLATNSKIRVRHSPATSGAAWSNAIDIGPAVPGTATSVALPLVPGTYLLKAYDSSGIASVDAAMVNTNAPSLLQFADIDTLTESPLFLGLKTDVVAVDNKLQLTGEGSFDDIPDFDSVVNLDAYGGIDEEGSYDFDGAIDLGSVQTVRLDAVVNAEVVNTLDEIDSRSASIDDWANFDGVNTASAGCRVLFRQTEDDPSGSPVWSNWNSVFAADARARAFEFKAELYTEDPAYNIEISELTVTVKEMV
ncbi:MAG: phage tail protein [Alphaproteobacteria bacterium]